MGTVKDVRVLAQPIIASSPPVPGEPAWHFTEDCWTDIRPAAEIDIEAAEVLSATDVDGLDSIVADGQPVIVTVRVGEAQTQAWSPRPRFDEDMNLTWAPTEEGALAVGDPIGVAMHYIESYSVWSLMGERLFGCTAAGDVLFQLNRFGDPYDPLNAANLAGPPPLDVDGRPLEDFLEEVRTCISAGTDMDAAIERQNFMKQAWGDGLSAFYLPNRFMAGYCPTTPDSSSSSDDEQPPPP